MGRFIFVKRWEIALYETNPCKLWEIGLRTGSHSGDFACTARFPRHMLRYLTALSTPLSSCSHSREFGYCRKLQTYDRFACRNQTCKTIAQNNYLSQCNIENPAKMNSFWYFSSTVLPRIGKRQTITSDTFIQGRTKSGKSLIIETHKVRDCAWWLRSWNLRAIYPVTIK